MREQFKRKEDLEKIEDQKYKEFQVAMDEENSIMKEINNVFATTPNQQEAEKIVIEKYASQMDEAMKKSRQALNEWLRAEKEPK